MKLFGLLPKYLGKIFNGVSHFACNSREVVVICKSKRKYSKHLLLQTQRILLEMYE